MASYNIEMQYYNGSGYDTLRPRTILNNITDWNNSIYSKSETNNLFNSYYNKSQTDNLFNNYYDKSEINNLLENAGGSSGWEQYRNYSINLTGDQSTTLISNDSTLPKYDWFFRYNLSTFSVLPKAQNCGLAINQSIFAYWIPKGDETSVLNATNISDYYFYHYVTFYSHTGYYSYSKNWPNRPENELRFLGYNKMGIDSYEVIYTYNKSSVGAKENTFVLNLMNGGSSARAVGTVTLYRRPNILSELGLNITK